MAEQNMAEKIITIETVEEVTDPSIKPMNMEASGKYNKPPLDHRVLSAVSVLFCPLIGLLAVIMSFVTTWRFEEGKKKRAYDASRDARFTAIFAIGAGIGIGFFFLFLYVIVPTF